MDDDKIMITDDIKKKVLEQLLPIGSHGYAYLANGDVKDRALTLTCECHHRS